MNFQRIVKYAEDEIIINEGEENSTIYKIISGKAAVYTNYGKENEYLIGILSSPRYFGEIECLSDKKSRYTIVAVTEMLVMTVHKEEFEGFVRNNPVNAIDIMKGMSKEVYTLNKHINMIFQEITEIIETNKTEKNDNNLEELKEKLKKFRTSALDLYSSFDNKI